MKLETILIDLDGTLIETNHFYHLPQLKCAEILYHEFLRESPRIENIFAETDRIRKEIQHSAKSDEDINDHFQQSWVKYYKNLCALNGMEPKESVKTDLVNQSNKYIQETYTLNEGVDDVLASLPGLKILVTMGSKKVQTHKIKTSNLGKHLQHIEIVPNKNVDTYKNILIKYNLTPSKTVMIGDNVRLDILPALKCDINVIHVLGKYQKPIEDFAQYNLPWWAEKRYQAIRSFIELPSLLT